MPSEKASIVYVVTWNMEFYPRYIAIRFFFATFFFFIWSFSLFFKKFSKALYQPSCLLRSRVGPSCNPTTPFFFLRYFLKEYPSFTEDTSLDLNISQRYKAVNELEHHKLLETLTANPRCNGIFNSCDIWCMAPYGICSWRFSLSLKYIAGRRSVRGTISQKTEKFLSANWSSFDRLINLK